mgnify:CR=1 FL=1
MQRKEQERRVAALRGAEGDTAMREKDRRNDARMFWIGIIQRALCTPQIPIRMTAKAVAAARNLARMVAVSEMG